MKIATIVGYFIPNPFLYIKTVLSQTIQSAILWISGCITIKC